MNKKSTEKKDKKLTVRQQRFVDAMADPEVKSVAEATRSAGYKGMVTKIGAVNMKIPHVLDAIKRERELALRSATVTRHEAVGRLVQIAFASMDPFVDENGHLDLKSAKEIGAFRFVRKFSEKIYPSGMIIRNIELHDPIAALCELASYAGWREKPNEREAKISSTARMYLSWLKNEDNAELTFETKKKTLETFAEDADISPVVLADKLGLFEN